MTLGPLLFSPPSLALSFPSSFLPWSICPLGRQEDLLFWRWFPWPEGGPAWGLCRPSRKHHRLARQHVQVFFSSEGPGGYGITAVCLNVCLILVSVPREFPELTNTHTRTFQRGVKVIGSATAQLRKSREVLQKSLLPTFGRTSDLNSGNFCLAGCNLWFFWTAVFLSMCRFEQTFLTPICIRGRGLVCFVSLWYDQQGQVECSRFVLEYCPSVLNVVLHCVWDRER